MSFIVEIADKFNDGVWVTYPKEFDSREEAERFRHTLIAAAPRWRLVRIRERFYQANDQVEAQSPEKKS